MSNDHDNEKPNGQMNGQHDPKITRFPAADERAARAAQQAEEKNAALPQSGSEPILNLPAGIKYLSLILLACMGLRYVLSDEAFFDLVMHFGFVPARYTGVLDADWRAVLAPVTHMFLHGGWLHIGVNIGMLMAFGSALEKTIGLKRAALIYFLSGVIGAGLHFAVMPQDISPLIGASGGISGLFGGMLILMFRSGLLGGEGYRRLIFLIVLWIGISLAFGYAGMPGTEGKVAWTAHVGGFIAGLALYPLLVRERLRLE
ncbi:MAG: rhomboid family intramembrane serine protease [Alphaproteobacteria bacterium]